MAESTTATSWPRRLSAPADTILDSLEAVGWTQADLAERMGRTKKHVQDLVKNKTRITSDSAMELSRTLGGSAQFWLNLEANYQAALAERKSLERHRSDSPWLKELPVADMVKLGWIAATSESTARVESCLRFFGVATVKAWRDHYATPLVSFRTGNNGTGAKLGAVTAWLRRAQMSAGRIKTSPWDKERFLTLLDDADTRAPSDDPLASFKPLQSAWAQAGVAVVFVRRPKSCSAFGAAEWLAPDRAMIVVSDRYATADQLWFTLFHEAAHLLLHAKKRPHVDIADSVPNENDAEEHEANSFAADRLIPRNAWTAFLNAAGSRRPDRDDVVALAERQGVDPGIVVGRLQHEKRIAFSSPLSSLKTRVTAEMFAALEEGA